MKLFSEIVRGQDIFLLILIKSNPNLSKKIRVLVLFKRH